MDYYPKISKLQYLVISYSTKTMSQKNANLAYKYLNFRDFFWTLLPMSNKFLVKIFRDYFSENQDFYSVNRQRNVKKLIKNL
jgi:hypothetical protein